ncbi:MAG: retropepsin-like aspartic protease [Pseudomonadota bacterium]
MMINQRFAIFFVLATALGLVAYIAGFYHGQSAAHSAAVGAASLDSPSGPITPNTAETVPLSTPSETVDPAAAPLLDWVTEKQWYALEQWLAAVKDTLNAERREAFLNAVRRNMNKYDAVVLRRLLRNYSSWYPQDVEAQFLLSDLQQMEGLAESALETLFVLLNGGHGEAVMQRARTDADRIINNISAGLKNRGAVGELVAFWEHVSQRYPASDYFRYEWARALAANQRWDDARRVLLETGVSDVAQTTLDALALELEEAEQGLQFQRRGDRLLAAVTGSAGGEYSLLVDTGANITSLSRQALRGLQAIPLGRTVKVRTAGGVVETSVYRVASMQVQGRTLADVRVLQMPVELPGVDGLLGVDVLRRLQWQPVDNL